ncbi:MAG: SurA N-terminal domain-containing protein [Marinifilaceae bacterium]|nr:SurA N-terminal domain-containing protein [Marinifilaceae bacterium]
MAALQTIREKAGITVGIVIGLALIAFVMGDIFTSGSSIKNSKLNVVGEIDGEEISIFTFQNALNEAENAYKANAGGYLTNEQMAQIRESVWSEMIYTRLLQEEANELGLAVSDDELFDLIYGNNISPVIYNAFGTQNPDEIRQIVQYVISNPNAGISWAGIQNEVTNNRVYEKYSSLLSNMFHTTSVEMDANLAAQANKFDVSYIVKRYSTVSDSTINVTESAISDYYNTHPVEQLETREIVYVAFDVIPTADDRQNILNSIQEMVQPFETSETPENIISMNSDEKMIPTFVAKNDIANEELAAHLFSNDGAKVYGPYEESGFYKITRAIEKKKMPKEVRSRHILIGGATIEEAKAIADSLAGVIKSGRITFADAATQYSMDQGSSVNGGDLGWATYEKFIPEFSDAIFNARVNQIGTVESGYGVHIYEVLEQRDIQDMVKIATVAKEIRPSSATEMAVTNDARKFAEGVTTAQELVEKAQAEGVVRRSAILDKNDPNVSTMTDSRELVQQAFLTEDANSVISNRDNSTVFAFGNKVRVVAALTKVNPEGIVPLADRKAEIRLILTNKEKANIIAKELSAIKANSQSLTSIQSQTGLQVQNAEDVTFNSVQLPGAGIEPAIIGAISTMNTGEISEPIAGNNGVYIVMVNNKTTDEITDEMKGAEEYRAAYMLNMKLNQQLLPVLADMANVKDYRYKFY